MAFFLDTYAGNPKRGSYTLTIEETGEQAVGEHTIKADFDAIIVNEQIKFHDQPRSRGRQESRIAGECRRKVAAEPRAGGDAKDAPE